MKSIQNQIFLAVLIGLWLWTAPTKAQERPTVSQDKPNYTYYSGLPGFGGAGSVPYAARKKSTRTHTGATQPGTNTRPTRPIFPGLNYAKISGVIDGAAFKNEIGAVAHNHIVQLLNRVPQAQIDRLCQETFPERLNPAEIRGEGVTVKGLLGQVVWRDHDTAAQAATGAGGYYLAHIRTVEFDEDGKQLPARSIMIKFLQLPDKTSLKDLIGNTVTVKGIFVRTRAWPLLKVANVTPNDVYLGRVGEKMDRSTWEDANEMKVVPEIYAKGIGVE